jgi:hypothetical protein
MLIRRAPVPEPAPRAEIVDPEREWRRVIRQRLEACNIVYGRWRGLPPQLIATDPAIDHGYAGSGTEPPERKKLVREMPE